MRLARSSGPALLAAWLTGCAVGPNYRTPETPVPSAFASQPPAPDAPAAAPVSSVDLTGWWRALGDAELDSLIQRAVRANPDIGMALTRLQEVRAREAGAMGAALPSVAASAAGGRGTGSDLTRAGAAPPLRQADNKGSLDQIRQVAGFSASWEIDLFGGYRRTLEAGRYDVEAATAARDVVLISVIADVARSYLDMRGLQARLAIIDDNIAAATQSRDLEQSRFDRGLTNELDLRLADRELSTLRAERPLRVSELESARYNIAVLLGEYPEQLAVELSAPAPLPALPEQVDAGLPLDLVRRRPDVREAERQLAAATARIGVATANLFPRLSLAGGLGTQSDSLGVQGSHIWAFGPALYWPLLDFGALDAAVDIADLRARGQLIAYKKALIAAVRDTDRAISSFSAQRERLRDLSDALAASQRAVSLAQQRYDRGLTDYLNVVDAEHQEYSLKEQYTAARQSAADAFVDLCLALGGGWQDYPSVSSGKPPRPAVIAGIRRLMTSRP